MTTNASTPFIGGSPMQITSGTLTTLLYKGELKVERVIWQSPSLASTSNVVITKRTVGANTTYLNLNAQVSGIAQSYDFPCTQWWQDPFIVCMPTGTLWIYYK